MSSFLLDMLIGMLDLTDPERAKFDAMTPDLADAADALSAAWPDIMAFNNVIITTQSLRNQVLTDVTPLVPNLAALLDGGFVDGGAAMTAVKSLQGLMLANPASVSSITEAYTKLLPFINKMIVDWPKIEPVIGIMEAACKRKGWSLSAFLGNLHNTIKTKSTP